jgi:acyl carrier protein
MDKQKIITDINETLCEEFELPMEKLTESATLADDLGLDSLDAVDMLVLLEDKVGIKIDAEKFQHVKTLGDVYKLVEEII